MKLRNILIPVLLVLVILLILASEPAVAQCSMCRKVATDGTAKREVANNINYAILYLMAIPYIALMYIFRKQIGVFIKQLRG